MNNRKTITVMIGVISILVLSTTLVTEKAMALDSGEIFFKDSAGQKAIGNSSGYIKMPQNETGYITNDAGSNPDMTKACQSLQDIINMDRSVGADSSIVDSIQKTHDDSC
jgi:hypothetical protein